MRDPLACSSLTSSRTALPENKTSYGLRFSARRKRNTANWPEILRHSRWEQYRVQSCAQWRILTRDKVIPVVISRSELPAGTWKELPEMAYVDVAPVLARERLFIHGAHT